MDLLSFTVLLSASLTLAQNQQPLYSTYAFNPLQHLAGIAPYFEPADPPRDPSPPQGCSVTRAAYLVRHAAINANDFDYEEYLEPFGKKLANTTVDWKRTTISAQSFIHGLEMIDDEIEMVTISESKKAGADSLTPYSSCPGYSSSAGSKQSSTYVKTYTAPILARFKSLAPAFNWTSDDVVGMQEWCGYDTVIRGSSPFCSPSLFRADEWLQFEYSQDIMYHYNTGYGQPLSGTIGFPWLNATLNTLSAPPSEDDQDIYVSFTHRELPPTVLVALGIFNNSESTGINNPNATMPLDRINYHRQWVSSYILPFLTNVAIEQMNCSASYGYENVTDPTFYRVVVNQSPQTLPDCYDGPLESCSASGMQKLVQKRGEMFGNFSAACGVTYDNTTDVLSIYSRNLTGRSVGK
ncbi:hypothetical protein LTR78_005900 [Recurvomyces mirabilis]|uniref:Acid phosphatase n=1 Tax=Recurvomyces mirabilis TaxID=574656 RepID=A0AAE0WLS2_9PEZI|nr:hypothetical protein LTR78_005900 [Recurvomyces mirabilis]